MADTALQLEPGSYIATKRVAYSTEIVRTFGGATHRNANWSAPLSTWDVTVYPCMRNSVEYLAAFALFDALLGSARTFIFHDPVSCVDVECCIVDDSLAITPVGNLAEVAFAVEEYR